MNTETFARTLADLAADLPTGHLTAWADALMSIGRPTDAVEAPLIDARPGYALSAAARRLVNAWRTHAPHLPGPAVGLALRSAAEVQRRTAAQRATLAISGPSSGSVPVRLTSAVIVEVIRSASTRLLVVSFAAYGVTDVVRELTAAANRGVRLDLVLEDSRVGGGTLHGPSGAASAFTELRTKASFWHWPADRRPVTGTSRAALHAKLVAADSTVALISSANLTDRAHVDQPRGRRRPTRPSSHQPDRGTLHCPHDSARCFSGTAPHLTGYRLSRP